MSKRVQKTFTISRRLYEKSAAHAESLGLTFPEYVRYLMIKQIDQLGRVEVMDSVTEERIIMAIQDAKEGRSFFVKKGREPYE